MNGTPDDIKQKQLEIWPAKADEERIKLTLQMRDELYGLWNEVKKKIEYGKKSPPDILPEPDR